MKMKYERPVMHAEMYRTNAYCVTCSDPNLFETIVTKESSNWAQLLKTRVQTGSFMGFPIYDYKSEINYDADVVGTLQYDFTHTFEKGKRKSIIATWNDNAQQYYWSSTGDDGTYYLEYSQEWTDIHNGNGNTGSFFVLYKETGGADGLQVNAGGFMGTPDDDLNDYIDTNNADMALAGVYFNNDAVYWS